MKMNHCNLKQGRVRVSETAQPNTGLSLFAAHSKIQLDHKMQGQRGKKKALLPPGESLEGYKESQ